MTLVFRKSLGQWLIALFLLWAAAPTFAQFRVEVSGVGLTQIPIAIASFKGQDTAGQKMSGIVSADLERSGQFRSIAALATADESSRPELTSLRQAGADSFVSGSVTKLADGRFDVRFRLWDVVKGQDLGGQSFAVSSADLRLAAHRISDFIYERLTGEKGVFSTRIAYITKVAQRFQLWVADADGENAQSALASPEPIISPAWSPDGNLLAYVSFESRKPVIYVHDVSTGKRRLIANFKGSNSAPAWSPDGKNLAVTLSRDGGSQLFLLSAAGGEPKRLIQSSSIDTEPAFSPDGRSIYFVSDRGGSPQVYRVAATGQNVERVTFTGTYNISPAIGSDGRWLAYISRVSGTETSADERPSFSPNSKLLVYATQQGGQELLMTSTLDGRVKARLNGKSGDVREPAWGPFFK